MAETSYGSPSENEIADEPEVSADDKQKADDEAEVLRIALERYERGWLHDRHNIENGYKALRFRAGEQWPDTIVQERTDEGRPCLTINCIPQYVHQVTGDMRQMRPAIKVVPVDNGGDKATAEVLEGMIRYIENRSAARWVYSKGADSQLCGGIGHWQVVSEYASDSTNCQELRIAPVNDGLGVIWDSDAILPTRQDAMWCFVPVDMARDVFKEKWPDATPTDFRNDSLTGQASRMLDYGWATDDTVRVAAYWVKKPIKKKMAVLADGSIQDVADASPEVLTYLEQQHGARIEERDTFKIVRYLLSYNEILEGPTPWPGRYIPIIPLVGEEICLGKTTKRHGLVEFLEDPQRRFNYFVSAQTEIYGLQPKAPWLGTEKNFEQYQAMWSAANLRNFPFLKYTPDPLNGNIPPQRVQLASPSPAVSEGVGMAAEDMKRVTGLYDASLGARSNETSGKAILARQREGDVGTIVYRDNFALSLEHTGRILVDLIPHYYDSQRIIRIIGEDGSVDTVTINQAVMLQGVERVLNDVTVGAYDVVIDSGPSYTTRRDEAKDGMKEFMQAYPPAAPIIGDLYAQAQDWPLADQIGERLRAVLPPQVKAAIAHEEHGPGQQPGGPQQQPQIGPDGQPIPPQPPQPSPEQIAQMRAQQMQEQAQQREMAVENAKAQAEIAKANSDIAVANINLRKAQIDLAIKEVELSQKTGQALMPGEPQQVPVGPVPPIETMPNGGAGQMQMPSQMQTPMSGISPPVQ